MAIIKRTRSLKKDSLESTAKKRARRDSIRRALLTTLAIAGALPIALAAPKVLSLLRDEHIDMFIPQDPRQRLHETASRLKRKGLIEFRVVDGKKRMLLTALGHKEVYRLQHHPSELPRPRKWDKRWRIVIFDIPETRKPLRNKIRSLVRTLGFIRLQDSVWVYPYDCEEVIALLKTDLKVGRNVLYLIADAIEFDKPLRVQFKLPLSD